VLVIGGAGLAGRMKVQSASPAPSPTQAAHSSAEEERIQWCPCFGLYFLGSWPLTQCFICLMFSGLPVLEISLFTPFSRFFPFGGAVFYLLVAGVPQALLGQTESSVIKCTLRVHVCTPPSFRLKSCVGKTFLTFKVIEIL
jgi:hypothetical protein